MTHGAAETRRARRKCKVFVVNRSKYVPLLTKEEPKWTHKIKRNPQFGDAKKRSSGE
jgi:hypothetical protein